MGPRSGRWLRGGDTPVCLHYATTSRSAERFGLSAQQFTDLVAVQLADHLEGFDNRAYPVSSPFLALRTDSLHG